MKRGRIASRRHAKVTPADKRKHKVVKRVFDARATRVRWQCQGVLARLRDAKKPQRWEAAGVDAYGIVACKTQRECFAVQWFWAVLSNRPNTHGNARFAAGRGSDCDS